jgi:hypothetical protein
MAKVNGKQKGNKFERDIANMFSERFAEYTGIEKAFRRNPDSGSFFGGTNVDRKDVYDTEWAIYGDLICPRNFNFTVECKWYKSAPVFNAVLTESITEWDDWIGQARQDAEACGKDMLIIIKYNRTQILTITEEDTIIEAPTIRYKDTEVHLLEDVLKIDPEPFFFTPKQEN